MIKGISFKCCTMMQTLNMGQVLRHTDPELGISHHRESPVEAKLWNPDLPVLMQFVTIHAAIGHFRFVPMLLPLHETITSLGSNLGTHRPFNTPYSNPSWDLCTIHAQRPFPIPLIYILPCLYILFLTLNIN